jgi:hypothetical protein
LADWLAQAVSLKELEAVDWRFVTAKVAGYRWARLDLR